MVGRGAVEMVRKRKRRDAGVFNLPYYSVFLLNFIAF
jgi:hypothetical protein